MVTVGQLVEILSFDLYRLADEAGERISLYYVREHLDGLKKHPQDCRCAEHCAMARAVKPEQVQRMAGRWQADTIEARRLRALRTAKSASLPRRMIGMPADLR